MAEDENSKIQEQQKSWFLLIDQKDEESSSKIAIYQTRCASFDLARSPLSLPQEKIMHVVASWHREEGGARKFQSNTVS